MFLFYFGFELQFVPLNLHLQSYEIWFVIVLVSFLFVIILNALTFISFHFCGTHILGNKKLQLPVHMSKLIMNG